MRKKQMINGEGGIKTKGRRPKEKMLNCEILRDIFYLDMTFFKEVSK